MSPSCWPSFKRGTSMIDFGGKTTFREISMSEDLKTRIIENNNQMLADILEGLMQRAWELPTVEQYNSATDAELKAHLDDMLYELNKRDHKAAKAWCKASMLTLYAPVTSSEPFPEIVENEQGC